MEDNFLTKVKKYVKIYIRFARFDLIYNMAYRTSFIIQLAVEIFYAFTSIVLFNVIYSNVKTIAGWSYYEMLFLIGLDMIISEFFVGLVFAYNTNNLPERVRTGEVDYFLLKPISSLFNLTIAQPYVTSLIATIPGFFLIFISIAKLQLKLHLIQIISGAVIFICGFIIGYAIMAMATSLAFVFNNVVTFPRIGMNLAFSFISRPHQIFNTWVLKVIFFLIIPAVFMASIPASTIIRGLELKYLLIAICLSVIFLFVLNKFWYKMISNYSSASS